MKQFIFLSSMSVYGVSEGMVEKKNCTSSTTHYGKSKYQAEKKLVQLSCEKFQIAIVRPPDGVRERLQRQLSAATESGIV